MNGRVARSLRRNLYAGVAYRGNSPIQKQLKKAYRRMKKDYKPNA